jgi:cytochrome d ubiquinol oxidase subunit I
MVWTSLIGFTLVYGALMAADVYLLVKYARKGAVEDELGADQLVEQPVLE